MARAQHTVIVEVPDGDHARVEEAVYAALTAAGIQIDEYHRERMVEESDHEYALPIDERYGAVSRVGYGVAGDLDAPAIPTDREKA